MQQHGLMQQKAKTRQRVLLLLLSIWTSFVSATAQNGGTAALNVPWTPLAP
jgi:Na+/H+ antiporter NhaD/arsenite permease-like protein